MNRHRQLGIKQFGEFDRKPGRSVWRASLQV
jgi:hypothetical protein